MNEENEKFYRECAEALGVEYECKPFSWSHSRRTRWNNRVPGSGRYPGFGTIRVFGNQVHVALRYPIQLTQVFESKDDVLTMLKGLDYGSED